MYKSSQVRTVLQIIPAASRGRRGAGALLLTLMAIVAAPVPASELQQLGQGALAGDELGYATATDGLRAVAGAPGENAEAGAVYVHDCALPQCPREARIAPVDLAAGHAFGSTLALSANTLAIGAPNQGAGAVYIFIRTAPGSWTQQAKLTDSGGSAGERFGSALALLGDTLLVGAEGDNAGRGSVYAYNRTGSTWALPSLLLAPDGAAGDRFGAAVALSSTQALVGAPYEGNSGSGQVYARGAAYAFERLSPTSWSAAPIKLMAATPVSGALFGYAVALQGDRGVVGAPLAAAGDGLVSVFEFTTGVGWSAVAEFGSSRTQPGAHLGWSLALDADQLTVGAPFDAVDAGGNCGQALRFNRVAAVWNEVRPLTLRGSAPGQLTGWTASAGGTRQAVGMPGSTLTIQHSGRLAWFDAAELVFGDEYESPDPLCVEGP